MNRLKKILLYACLVMSGAVLTAGFVMAKSGLTEEEINIFSQNDITFYEPCGSSGGSSECGITVTGSTIEEKIWSGLTSFMSDEQAAGVMGNMAHEGGFNPARHETKFLNNNPNYAIKTNTNNSYGIGLIQWSFGRRTKLLSSIQEKASDLLDKYIDAGRKVYGAISGSDFLSKAGDEDTNTLINLELCFLKQEIENNSTYGGILNTSTVEEASNYFLEKVEVPANIPGQRPIRYADAQKYYDQFHGKTVSGVSSSEGSDESEGAGDPCDANAEGSKNINGAAVALAWPLGTDKSKYSWKGGSGTDLFNEVYPKLLSKGARQPYKGCKGPVYGASCDRFVSTVVRYSGYDKKFPTGVGLSERTQGGYVLNHPELWERINWDGDPSKLKAGDVVLRSGHVAVAVQDEDGKFYIAEAGLCSSYGHIRNIKKKENFDYIIRATKANNTNAGVSVKNGVTTSSTTGTLESGASCNLCADGGDAAEMQLKAGGMTLAEAKDFMKAYHDAAMGKYYKKKYDITFQGAKISNANCPYGVMNNCVAFSQWFINKYTTIGPNWGNTTDGVGMVNRLASSKGLKKGVSPRPYAIFSNAQWSGAGHTGVVLGVDSAAKKIVVGEASCSWSGGGLNYSPQAKEYSFDYIKKHNWTFAYTDDVLSMGGVLKNV